MAVLERWAQGDILAVSSCRNSRWLEGTSTRSFTTVRCLWLNATVRIIMRRRLYGTNEGLCLREDCSAAVQTTTMTPDVGILHRSEEFLFLFTSNYHFTCEGALTEPLLVLIT